MTNRACYFCGKALRAVAIAGRVVLPGYCWKCGQEKNREFGVGWEQEPWAKFLFADVAREARDDEREGHNALLDAMTDIVPAPTIGEGEQPCQSDPKQQAILALFVSSNLGARKLKRVLSEAGEDRSLWQVQEALRVAVREGLRTARKE